jgi:mRNA interferase MazF
LARGDIVSIATGSGFGSKPRPAIVIQSDAFADLGSVTVCLLTSQEISADLLRPQIRPSPENGLNAISHLMIDKLMSVRLDKVGRHIGQLSRADMARVDQALKAFLDLAG